MKDFSEARKALKGLKTLPKPQPMKWLEPWTEIDCPLKCGGTIYLDKVNEDYIEESGINPDFVEGDNWLHDQRQKDHPPYVPDHHIFLADGLFKIGFKKVVKTMTHELAELLAEEMGYPYEKAHEEVANPVETEVGEEIHAETEG